MSSGFFGDVGSARVEGKRPAQLRKVFLKAVDKTFEGYTRDKLLGLFPPELVAERGAVLQDYTNQVLNKLRRNIQLEFETICEEADVDKRLEALDRLDQEQTELLDGSRLPPFPKYTPDEQAKEMIIAEKRRQREWLTQRLEQIERENQQLKAELLPKRQKVTKLETTAREISQALRTASENIAQAVHVADK